MTCWARHYDLWEERSERWGLISRATIADKDRIDPVNSEEVLRFDKSLLERFPADYRYLAYLQTKAGYDVDPDVPRFSGGNSLEALYERGRRWLDGKEWS
jgi:hypothetical protein